MFEAYYSQLNTPCLVVDEPMTRENIKRMQQVADANGCTLRPHIKTHKTPYFAKLQQQLGARGITSCKVSEAEVMADAGLRDIFIAYPLVGAEKLRRACALAQRVDRLILAVDSIAQGTPLAEAAKAHDVVLEVRSEVDCGVGSRQAPKARFRPTPNTMTTSSSTSASVPVPDDGGITSSESSPPSLSPWQNTSFGHLSSSEQSGWFGAAPYSSIMPFRASSVTSPAIICSQPLTDSSVAIARGMRTA